MFTVFSSFCLIHMDNQTGFDLCARHFQRLLGQILDIGWVVFREIHRVVFREIHLVAGQLPQELLDPQLPQLVQALLDCKKMCIENGKSRMHRVKLKPRFFSKKLKPRRNHPQSEDAVI